MSPAGTFIPPLIVFPRKRMNTRLMINALEGSAGVTQHNGWMDGENFLAWLKNFVEITRPTEDSPILIVLDGHGSHKDLDVIDYSRANHLHLLSLSPHTIHKWQPLDRTFMKPFKQAYSEECALWMRKNPGLSISDYDVAGLVNEAYKKVCRIKIATNGFACTGIHPFNPKIFMDAEFAPSLITGLPQDNAQEIGAPIASCSIQRHELVELEDGGQNLTEENSCQNEFVSHLDKLMSLPDSM